MASTVVSGHIDVSIIEDARDEMLVLVKEYRTIVAKAETLSTAVQLEWVGKGATSFESWYEIIKSKLNDYTEMLEEMYDALFDAYNAYSEGDSTIANELNQAIS